ncbi:MAG: hypothetical protein K2X86_11720 [Cytophagaceae bacterium]|nr:hypothetical protein [Cytophagaceae bacterium]
MKNIKFFIPIILITIFSCAERNTNIGRKVVVKPHYAKVNLPEKNEIKNIDYLSRLETPSEYFYIFPNSDTTIYGEKGTQITIHAGCITYKDDSEVKGVIEVELKELFSKADLVLTNKPTVANRQMLISAGSLYINARAEEQDLAIICPDGITVSIPRNMDNGEMDLFLGQITKRGNVNWVKDSSLTELSMNAAQDPNYEEVSYENPESIWYNPEMLYSNGDNVYEEDYISTYLFTTGKFGWINCDRFYDDPGEKVNMVVKLKETLPLPYKTNMYVVFKNINSVMQLYTADNEIYESTDLPKGEEVYLVTVSANEGRNFFSIESLVVEDKMIMPVVPLKETTKDEIKKRLEELN